MTISEPAKICQSSFELEGREKCTSSIIAHKEMKYNLPGKRSSIEQGQKGKVMKVMAQKMAGVA